MSTHPDPLHVQEFLVGLDYPMSRSELVDQARTAGADEATLQALRRLPDRSFDGPDSVSAQIARGT